MFRQDCTCPALLFVLHALVLSCTGLSPAMAALSRAFHYVNDYHLRLFPFRSPLLWESRLISFPAAT